MAGNREKFNQAIAQAEQLIEQENWAEAGRKYRYALAEFPNDLTAIIGFGRASLHGGELKIAQKAFMQALRLEPSNTEALLGIGRTLEAMDQLESAVESYMRAGNYLVQNDVEAAIEAWQQVVRLRPDNLEATRNLARSLAWLGRPEPAARYFLSLAGLYQAQGKLDQARHQVAKAEEQAGDDFGVQAAYQALEQGDPIDPEKLGQPPPAQEEFDEFLDELAATPAEAEPEPPAAPPPEEVEPFDFGEEFMQPPPRQEAEEEAPFDFDDEFMQPTPTAAAEEDSFAFDEEDPFDFSDAFDEPAPTATEEDPFALFEDEAAPSSSFGGSLVEAAQQEALSKLANVIFEEDEAAYATLTMPREEVNLLIIQAIDMQRQDGVAEAIENYRQVVKAGASRPALYFNLGLLCKDQGLYDEAIKMLKAAAMRSAYSVAANFALGEVYRATNNQELAVHHFLETLKMVDLETVEESRVPLLEDQYQALSENYMSQNEPAQLNAFITAVQNFFVNPDWESKVYEARHRMDSVTEDEAIMSLAEFLETPETEVVITTMALTDEYLRQNLPMTASEECLRAIQKAPTYLPLHERLADILLKQNHTDGAINKYLYISKVYQMRAQPEKSVGVYEKVLRLAPMDVTVRSKLIDLYISRHKYEQALEEYLTLADSYYQLAQVDRSVEKYNEALRLTQNVEEPDPWKAKILNRMGDIYIQRFDWSKAASAFKELLAIKPDDERAQRQYIDLSLKQFKTEEALTTLDRLLNDYQRQNRPQKMIDLLKDLIESYPDNMLLRQRLAVVYRRNGMKEEAIAQYDKLGDMQLQEGMKKEAEKTIQTILALGPENAEGYEVLLSRIRGGEI